MPKLSRKILKASLILVVLAFIFPPLVLAAISIDSASLNGGSSVTVAPGASISASVTVTTSGGGAANDWSSTSWEISGQGANCVDTTDYTDSGTYSESFGIQAPSTPGTYSVSFIAYRQNGCSGPDSGAFTLTDSIIVQSSPSPTPSPTPGPSPGASPTPSSTTAVNYPQITLTLAPSNIGAFENSVVTGTASVNGSTIKSIEYSTNNGVSWTTVSAQDGSYNSQSENFSLRVTYSADGVYEYLFRALSVQGNYTEAANYARLSLTVSPVAPSVTLDRFRENPTQDTTPTIEGSVSRTSRNIARVEISFDAGNSWQKAVLTGSRFSLTSSILEDDDYPIVARAIDTEGREGRSDTQTLTVDNLPPIIGGSIVRLGTLILSPTRDGILKVAKESEIDLILLTKGGVVKASVKVEGKEVVLERTGKGIFEGKLLIDHDGLLTPEFQAEDGAGRQIAKKAPPLYSLPRNAVVSDGRGLEAVEVTLYYYSSISDRWLPWDAKVFGQTNPIVTTDTGKYSFVVPGGKYFLSVKKPGFRQVNSEIFEAASASVLSSEIPMAKIPSLSLTLPIIGRITLSLPAFPQSVRISTQVLAVPDNEESLVGKTLPTYGYLNPEGEISALPKDKRLISFVSIWSPHALDQLAIFQSLLDETNDIKLTVIFVQNRLQSINSFVERGRYGFDYLVDESGAALAPYPVQILPTSFVVDPAGKIEAVYSGRASKESLLEGLAE